VGFVDFIIKKLTADFHISERRIYATGISNGGIFCHYLAVSLPMTFAAIAPVIGSIAENVALSAKPDFPLSVLMINGTDDPLVPFAGGGVGYSGRRGVVISAAQSFAFWKKVCGISGESYISYLKDPLSGERNVKVLSASGGRMNTEIILYTMIGAGHVWPGRKIGFLQKMMVGKGCETIDGTELIFSFFESHVRFDLPEKTR
jgi:polyhydroxybutyrate depolymerase